MVPLLLLTVSVGVVTSLLPFLIPETAIALFGVVLNHWIAGLLADLLDAHGALFATGPTGLSLSLEGVLVVYVPLLLVLGYLQAGR